MTMNGEERRIRLHRLGNDQIVRIPKAFEFDASEVCVWREGEQLVISALPAHGPPQAEADEMEPR